MEQKSTTFHGPPKLVEDWRKAVKNGDMGLMLKLRDALGFYNDGRKPDMRAEKSAATDDIVANTKAPTPVAAVAMQAAVAPVQLKIGPILANEAVTVKEAGKRLFGGFFGNSSEVRFK